MRGVRRKPGNVSLRFGRNIGGKPCHKVPICRHVRQIEPVSPIAGFGLSNGVSAVGRRIWYQFGSNMRRSHAGSRTSDGRHGVSEACSLGAVQSSRGPRIDIIPPCVRRAIPCPSPAAACFGSPLAHLRGSLRDSSVASCRGVSASALSDAPTAEQVPCAAGGRLPQSALHALSCAALPANMVCWRPHAPYRTVRLQRTGTMGNRTDRCAEQ